VSPCPLVISKMPYHGRRGDLRVVCLIILKHSVLIFPGFMVRPREVENRDKHYYLLGDKTDGRAIQ